MKTGTMEKLRLSIEQKLKKTFQDPVLCTQYSWWILEALTGQKKEQLITRSTDDLSEEQLNRLDDWMKEILNRNKPLQYILGSVPFLDLEILVEPPTLIPRPETEELCADLITQLTQLNNQKIKILDIGTGSGCIALSLAKALPNAQVYATDIADAALELAQKNATHNNIKNISFIKSDVFQNIPTDLKFDLIVSNPPYIAPEEWKDLDPSVVEWEDRTALIAQNKGLAIIERIVKQAPQFLKENKELAQHNVPQLLIEIGYTQGSAVSRLLENAGFDAITIKKDLEGKDRIVTGRVKDVAIQSEKK